MSILTDYEYNNILNKLKSFIVSKNINNKTFISELISEGSNLSTILDVVAFFYTISNFKLDTYMKQLDISTSDIDSNIIRQAKNLGLIPYTKRSSYIDVKLRSKTSDLNLGEGSIILSSVSNSNIEFYYNNTESNLVLSNTSSIFRFRQGKKATTLRYNIDTDNNYRVYLPHKWNIDYTSLRITSGVTNWTKLESDLDINYIRDNFYYTLDLSDDQGLVIEFLGSLIGQSYTGAIEIEYYLCDGSIGNSILDTDLKIKSTTIPGLTISQIEIVYVKNKSLNGLDETSISQVQRLAPSYFKNNNRIVTREDLEVWLKLNFSDWNIKILDNNNLINNRTPGRVYVGMYRINNDIIENYPYNSFDWSDLYNKLSIGTKVVFFDISEVTYEIYCNTIIKGISKQSMDNNIKSSMMNYFKNNSSISRILIQKEIINKSLNGLIDFNISEIKSLYILDAIEPSSTMTFKMGSINNDIFDSNDVFVNRFRAILSNFLINIPTGKGVGNNNILSTRMTQIDQDRLINLVNEKFSNYPSNLITYDLQDTFSTHLIPFYMMSNLIVSRNINQFEYYMNNLSIELNFEYELYRSTDGELTYPDHEIIPIESSENIGNNLYVSNKILTLTNSNKNTTLFLQNEINLYRLIVNNVDTYCLDEDYYINIRDTTSTPNIDIRFPILNKLNSYLDKPILGLYYFTNTFGNNYLNLTYNSKFFNKEISTILEASSYRIIQKFKGLKIRFSNGSYITTNPDAVGILKSENIHNSIMEG